MIKDIPQHFDETFLLWFRQRTEATWQNYQTKPFQEYVTSRTGGSDWQQGTRWLNGLSEQEIVTIEQRYHLRFPPDYRLFLKVLHSVDRPRVGARYSNDKHIIPSSAPSFYNWQTDTEAIQTSYELISSGLLFDVQHANLWPPTWGAKPTSIEGQEARIKELVDSAPKLIPLFSHRFLLAEPCAAGNPILSIHQSDMIIYAVDLYHYFLVEFGDLCGISREDRQQLKATFRQEVQARAEAYQAILFWSEFIFGDIE